jgi:exonuclease SbcD
MQQAKVEKINLRSGRPLVRWKAQHGLPQVMNWIEEGKDKGSWIELEIHLDEFMTSQEFRTLVESNPYIVNIRPVVGGIAEEIQQSLSGMPVDELFRLFCLRQTGLPADEKLVRLFLELLNDGEVN